MVGKALYVAALADETGHISFQSALHLLRLHLLLHNVSIYVSGCGHGALEVLGSVLKASFELGLFMVEQVVALGVELVSHLLKLYKI